MTTIAGVGRKFSTEDRNDKQDMPYCPVEVGKEDGKM